MLDQRPLKVGQALIHDVRGQCIFNQDCADAQKKSTSKQLLWVFSNEEMIQASRSCLSILRVVPPAEVVEEYEAEEIHQDLDEAGLIVGINEAAKGKWKKMVVTVCPACNSQEEIPVDIDSPEQTPEIELCSSCADRFGEF